MPFDILAWGVGFAASKGAGAVLEKVFAYGAYEEIQAAASKWSFALPAEIRTPADALFNAETRDADEEGLSRTKLKKAILELHKVPSEEEWLDALIESWELKRQQLGADANAFFRLDRKAAEGHLHQLAEAIYVACASVLKYSLALILTTVRKVEIITQSLFEKVESFESRLNNRTADRNEPLKLNFDPTHIEEDQLHLLNEIACVDSASESIAGRYRTHEIWVGPPGCTKESASYVPIGPQYVERRLKTLLKRWNETAIDLAKLSTHEVTSALASFHHRFLEIHPYPDGNGRVARAILDLHVRNFTSSTSPLRLKSHDEYYLALSAADGGNLNHLIALLNSILKRDIGN